MAPHHPFHDRIRIHQAAGHQFAKRGPAPLGVHRLLNDRSKDGFEDGLQSLRDAGCTVFSTETAVFQLLKVAATPEFKKVASLIR
jgi:hypothetical protein